MAFPPRSRPKASAASLARQSQRIAELEAELVKAKLECSHDLDVLRDASAGGRPLVVIQQDGRTDVWIGGQRIAEPACLVDLRPPRTCSEGLLKIDEVAVELAVSERKVRDLIHARLLSAVVLPSSNNGMRVERFEVEDFIRRNRRFDGGGVPPTTQRSRGRGVSDSQAELRRRLGRRGTK